MSTKGKSKPPKIVGTRSDEEVDDILNICGEWQEQGGTQYRGKSYEEGVLDGINWLRGDLATLELNPPDDEGDEGEDEDSTRG